MNVLSVAFPLLPVGPDSGGGAEQILFLVERGLVETGHRSIVVAAEGSKVSGELVPTPAFQDQITEQVQREARRIHLRSIERVLKQEAADLIHFHGLDFYAYQSVTKIARLATLHLPPAWYPSDIFRCPDIQLNCVSESQAKSVPVPVCLPVVCNGVDLERYKATTDNREHLLWLGRICPEKGVHIALEIAHRLDWPLVVAGPVHPFHDHQVYFAENVAPLLDGKRRYAGPVGVREKAELLARARALLIPSLVAETSSLVAMEAISSGTPVIAFRSGALPEIVEEGVTGSIVDSAEAMAAAVEQLDRFSPEICRARAEVRFDSRRMVAEYLELYERTIRNAKFGE